MPKILCKCDNVINLVLISALDGYKVVSEKMVDSLYGKKVESPDEIVSEVQLKGTPLYKCPACGRLIIFWDQNDPWPTFYLPEANESKPSSEREDSVG